jgi:hypothetical protein
LRARGGKSRRAGVLLHRGPVDCRYMCAACNRVHLPSSHPPSSFDLQVALLSFCVSPTPSTSPWLRAPSSCPHVAMYSLHQHLFSHSFISRPMCFPAGSVCCAGALHHVDADVLGWWLSERQCDSGGLNGRPEKQADVCYSWWILSALAILGVLLSGSTCTPPLPACTRHSLRKRAPFFVFLIHRFPSISFTRAQGIPKYKIGFGKEKDGRVGERLVERGGGHGAPFGEERPPSHCSYPSVWNRSD